MGAARKLQSEIDRCLKKVQEGIDEFDQIWQKVHDTENANQKEKFEADLKKEIKKLQRLRDQIKSWISGGDIKDKSALMEARKSIEREMERFKTCEKEAKMKQFSKAALGQADKLDPREQAKAESREWINELVDRLNVRIEGFEYEMEELAAGLKKKAKPPPKLAKLEEVVTVHKKHASALEKALRCLDNDAITSEEIDPLRDDLDYYLGMELDEHYDNTDDMYCEIADRLEAVEAAAPAAPSLGGHLAVKGKDGKAKGSGGGGKDDDEREKEKERERERAAAAAVKAQLIAQGNSNVKLLEEDDRGKPAAGPATLGRPPAIATSAAAGGAAAAAGPGALPPPSPLGTPAAAAALANSGGSGGALLPSPPAVAAQQQQQQLQSQGSLREDISVPASPAHQAQQVPNAAAGNAAAGAPADAAAAPAAAGAQNGVASVASPVAAAPPPAAAGPAAAAAGGAPAPAAAAAAGPAAAAGRPAGVTLAALIGSSNAAAREQQQQQQQQQQKQAEQQQAAAAAAAAAQQQQQQQQAASPGAGGAAAATPSGGRLGAWMAGVPESAKAAAAAGGPQAAAAAAAAAPSAAAVLAKGIPGQKTPAAAAGQQQQQSPGAAAAGKPDATNGPLPSPRDAAAAAGAGDGAVAAVAAAAAAAGVAPPDGASGAAMLEVWSRAAAAELGLGSAMHGQVPRSFTALQVLEGCMRSALPQPSDSDWNRPKPRHPIVGPGSYPKTQPEVISAPGLFRKMDPEALFFAFYYQPDTYQQYLAAQELKRQSWRYHKHHNAWFQRYAEPAVTAEEYEAGTYVYFDYNIMHDDLQTGWCYRRKENFTFRYDALEDELPVQQV